jgi:cellulose biosynthesis protein BcsQ
MIVAVGSWRGIGTTTMALLAASCLATREGTGTWLIEADPAGGALAGRMQLPPDIVGGLERVAFPRERMAPLAAFESVAHPVGGLRLVTAPSDPFRAHACHQPRLPWIASLRELADNVVVDVGRLRSGTPTWPILTSADVVLLVASPEVSAAVSTSEWMQAHGRVSPVDPGIAADNVRIVFVDSPAGVSFPRATVHIEFRDQSAVWLPWEPATVDLIHRGALANDRRLRRSALIAAANRLAVDIATAWSTPTERVDA